MPVSKSAAAAHAPSAGSSAAKADWRAQRLDHLRSLIQAAAPEATEEAKWKKTHQSGGGADLVRPRLDLHG